MTFIYPVILFSFIIAFSTFIKKDILKICSFKEFIYLEYILLALPIILLYEISIYIAKIIQRNRNDYGNEDNEDIIED